MIWYLFEKKNLRNQRRSKSSVKKFKMKISVEEAVRLWMENRSCDNILKLLISGAATKPEVKKILEKNFTQQRRSNRIRRKAYHGNYKSMFNIVNRKKKPLDEQEFTLK